jgi:hypothetical protein
MRGDVMVSFRPDESRQWSVDTELDNWAARSWLDAQFLELECEPLRASGKVLIADKLLAIADAAGDERFADADWGRQFAEAVVAATQRTLVRIDLAGRSVNY